MCKFCQDTAEIGYWKDKITYRPLICPDCEEWLEDCECEEEY